MGRVLVARRVGGYHAPVDPPVTPPTPGTGGSGPLARWFAALAGRDKAPAKILCWGDSRTEGEGATSLGARWQDILASNLRGTYPTAGATAEPPHNYVPLKYIAPTLAGQGEWSAVTVASSPNNFGLGTRVSILSAAGQGGTLTFTGTSCKIAYVKPSAAGSFSYAVDGGAAQTVSWAAGATTDGLTASITGLSDTAHTIDVRWVSGTVYLAGAYLFRADETRGIHVYDGGHYGTRAGNTYGAGRAYVTQAVRVVDPALVVLGLGTNDLGGNIDPESYRTDMVALIAAFKAACSSPPSIVLTLDWRRTGTYTYPWTSYLQVLRDIAAADPTVALFDLQAAFPTAPDNALGYFRPDMVHETNGGQSARAELLQALLTPPADGGTPLPPPPTGPATVSTPWLAFDLPAPDVWKAAAERNGPSDRILTVHVMQTMRRAIGDVNIDTTATAYERKYWIAPGGIENPNAVPPAVPTDHRAYGGFWRNSPIGRNSQGTGFTLTDKRWEVRAMQAAGITHLNIDILGSDTFNHCLEWIQAAHAEGWRNRVILTPDCGASIVRNGPANLAGFLKQAYTGAYSAALRKWRDGRWLTMPYSPETALGSTPTAFTDAQLTKYWTDWSAAMVAQGTPAVMWCCFQRAWRDPAQHTTNLASPSSGVFNGPALSGIVVGLGRWNPRNPDEADSTSIDNGGAPALSRTAAPTGYGLPFLYTQAVEDERPDQSKFEECRGWDNLVSWWEMVLRTGTEAVQIATWNDRRENTGIEPSKYHGYADLDVMSYYACRYVLGYDPPLVRDALYLAHRVQHPPAFTPQPTYTAGAAYTKRMVKAGTTAEWSQVDVLVFAKAPAEVSVTIAGVARTVTYGTTTGTSVSVPAGISRVQAPMASGAVVATLKRAGAVVPGGTVTSPFPINLTSQLVQDLTYRRTSSLR